MLLVVNVNCVGSCSWKPTVSPFSKLYTLVAICIVPTLAVVLAVAIAESVTAGVMLLMVITLAGPMLVTFAVVILAPAKLEILTPFLDTTSWFVHITN